MCPFKTSREHPILGVSGRWQVHPRHTHTASTPQDEATQQNTTQHHTTYSAATNAPRSCSRRQQRRTGRRRTGRHHEPATVQYVSYKHKTPRLVGRGDGKHQTLPAERQLTTISNNRGANKYHRYGARAREGRGTATGHVSTGGGGGQAEPSPCTAIRPTHNQPHEGGCRSSTV